MNRRTTITAAALLLLFAMICPVIAGCSPTATDAHSTSGPKKEDDPVVTTAEPGKVTEIEPGGTEAPDVTGDPGGQTLPVRPAVGELIITEATVSNKTGPTDSFGEHSDWIELYNASDREIPLIDCYLSDDPGKPAKFRFPDITIEPYGYLVVFASGRGVNADGEIHASFKLSTGENVYLSSGSETISVLYLPEDLPDDLSYGLFRDGEGFVSAYFAVSTPGAGNSDNYSQVLSGLRISDSGLVINEFQMNNDMILYDEDGDSPDWVEIRNISDSPVSLGGFGLSDRFDDRLKWTFPDVTVESGGYLLVLLSGKQKVYSEDSVFLHAGFKLGDGDDGLVLSDRRGVTIDRIATVTLPDNTSYGRDPDDIDVWKFFTRPTPGSANGKNGFESLEIFEKSLAEKVYISEVCAVSSSSVDSLPDNDWIELYNNTEETVDLSGWSISKYISDLKYYEFPKVTIAPHSYLVIDASGVRSYSVKSLDAGFKVNYAGSTLYLVDPEGYIADSFSTGVQRAGVTSGRVIENNRLERRFFQTPTKGVKNDESSSGAAYALPASIVSSAGALIADSHTITITTLQKNGEIRYTLDGTEPSETSAVYTGPFTLEKSTAVRAIVYAPSLLPSEIATATFLIENPHSLNVVCLTCDPDDLFGYRTGIWADGPGWTEASPHKGANYWKDWERKVHFEFYEKDGTLGIAFNAGIKNHGQYSRAKEQKSVSINMKEAYGSGTINYPFFGTDELSTFDNILLRTASQDWNYTSLIDAYCARVVKGQMDLDIMRDLPVAVYVNGEYWGLYYIRDKINESYIYYRTGIEEDDLDAIKGNKTVETGSFTAHNELLTYIKNHNLANQEYFDYVASKIDLEEWTNYWITESFLSNTDTGNIRFYCSKSEGGKWRWILFDMDWALYKSTYKWNMIEEFIDTRGHGVSNAFSTVIAVGLFKNAEFKKQFIEKYAEYMHTVFATDRMLSILDELVEEIRDEMPRQCERWGAMKYTTWEKNIALLREIIAYRWEKSILDLKNTFKLSDAYINELFPDR